MIKLKRNNFLPLLISLKSDFNLYDSSYNNKCILIVINYIY